MWLLSTMLTACSADTTPTSSGGGGRRGPSSATGSAGGPHGPGGAGSDLGVGNPGPSAPGTGGASAPTMVPVDESCAAISQTADNRLQPADIIIAVDNSGSMDEEIVFVRQELNAFSQQIVDSGVDVRIILISAPIDPNAMDMVSIFDENDQDNGICIDPPLGSGSCPGDSNPPRYLHVPTEVASHDALNLFVTTYPQWRDQLRANATKTFVVVTDDNAEDEPNNSAAAFTTSVMNLDPVLFAQWSFSGIYCFTECPYAAEVGAIYHQLVTQTQGVGGDLCLQDFKPVFDKLAKAVVGASSIDCQWDIPPAPQGQTFEIGKVNVQYTADGAGAPQTIFHVPSINDCGAQGGWHYNDPVDPTQVIVCPATCDLFKNDVSARLDVLFGCDTKEGPD